MKALAAVGAFLILGASALACDGLLGISIIQRTSLDDAGDGATTLIDSGEDAGPDAEPDADAQPGDDDVESGPVPACILSELTLSISAGTLSPTFEPAVLSYTVTSSATSLGVPFTVTPTASAGCVVTVNGAAVVSGEASSPIVLGLISPTPIDVAVTPLEGTATTHYAIVVPPVQEAYVKASNTRASTYFGSAVALSSDGNTLAVGSYYESSAATGINGDQSDTSAEYAGAVYVFARTGTTWTQQAYVKASNTRANAFFGSAVALSSDGNTLAVGDDEESSAATGIYGNQSDTSAGQAGAVYVFARAGTTWTQQAYVKASNTRSGALFGSAVALSSDGNTLAVGSYCESSAATGIDGDQSDTSAAYAGAVYVFARTGTMWTQGAYIKASNTKSLLPGVSLGDQSNELGEFGFAVALSSDGNTLAVGAPLESSDATGINGHEGDTSALYAGAVYVFSALSGAWTQQAYVKASNTNPNVLGYFGWAIALSSDGNTLAAGSPGESSAATGINGYQSDASATDAGAVYVFARTGSTWSQQAYVKASNSQMGAQLGSALALSSDGNTLAVGSPTESSGATGVNGNQNGTSAPNDGAVFVFGLTGTTWAQHAYDKASNTRAKAYFGCAVALSPDGNTLAMGSYGESSAATGVNQNESDIQAGLAGAAYVLR